MNIPPDIYEYLTNFADDKTILNMLITNKKFNDDIFFERVVRRKYPLLAKLKENNISWKKFYLKMVYYIDKLKVDYDIPYIPTKDYDPIYFYKVFTKFGNAKDMYNEAMVIAARGGHIDIVKSMIEKGANSFKYSLIEAARNGQIDVVQLLLNYIDDKDNLNLVMRYAAEEGYINIVRLLINYGANNFSESMVDAARGGRIDIVKLMIEYGANLFDDALVEASYQGHLDIVKLMIKYGATDIKEALRVANMGYHPDIIDYLSDY